LFVIRLIGPVFNSNPEVKNGWSSLGLNWGFIISAIHFNQLVLFGKKGNIVFKGNFSNYFGFPGGFWGLNWGGGKKRPKKNFFRDLHLGYLFIFRVFHLF